jgi:hypothetical protein
VSPGHETELAQDWPKTDSPSLRFSSLRDFAVFDEPSAKSLLGSPEESVLAVGGDLLVYGAAGAGKTTWVIDGIAHLAAGIPWLGLAVPRPLTISVIENEGPRGKFRQKLASKLETWDGPPFDSKIHVMEEPWASFTFADPQHRQGVAKHLNATDSDVLVCGPVSSLGMTGGGTPDEINAFVSLLAETRALVRLPVAFWLIHHENRAGQVSGAWERVPDTLVHITTGGNGRTRIFWQKVRWSSELHGTSMHLAWTACAGFALEHAPQTATADRIWVDIAAFVLANGGCSWTTVEKAKEHVSGKAELKRKTRDQMLAEGVLVNVGSSQGFELWHRDDPARPIDLSDEVHPPRDGLADGPGFARWTEGVARVRPPVPSVRRDGGGGRTGHTSADPLDERVARAAVYFEREAAL